MVILRCIENKVKLCVEIVLIHHTDGMVILRCIENKVKLCVEIVLIHHTDGLNL